MGALSQGNSALPLLQQDLISNVNNFYPTKARGFVFGRRASIDNLIVDLWEGPTDEYVYPSAGMQFIVTSDNASDTFAIGVGAWELVLHCLNASGDIQTITVRLNGLGGVATTALDLYRINGAHVISAGTLKRCAGNISIKGAVDGITYAYISAGRNTARQAIYTVPAAFTGYISHWQTSSGSSGAHFCESTLLATTHDGVLWPGIMLIQDEIGTQNGGEVVNFPIPIPIPAMSDVKIRAISDGGLANVTGLGAIMGWFE